MPRQAWLALAAVSACGGPCCPPHSAPHIDPLRQLLLHQLLVRILAQAHVPLSRLLHRVVSSEAVAAILVSGCIMGHLLHPVRASPPFISISKPHSFPLLLYVSIHDPAGHRLSKAAAGNRRVSTLKCPVRNGLRVTRSSLGNASTLQRDARSHHMTSVVLCLLPPPSLGGCHNTGL